MRFVRAIAGGHRIYIPGLHDIIWWLLAVGIVVAGAVLFWTAITPVSPLGEWRPTRVRVMDSGLRSALITGFDPFNRDLAIAAAGPATAGMVTDLPLTLYGIRFNPLSGAGSAIIGGSDGVQDVYRIGDEIMPGATLSALAFDHVTISRGGSSELLYLDQSKPVNPTVPVVRPPRTSTLGGASVSELQGAINFGAADGGGLTVTPGGDGSVFARTGLRSGDVVTGVNGTPVSGQQDAARIAGALRPGSTLNLTVRRNGREVPVNITVSE